VGELGYFAEETGVGGKGQVTRLERPSGTEIQWPAPGIDLAPGKAFFSVSKKIHFQVFCYKTETNLFVLCFARNGF
jgi:hypothetical protein